MKKTVILSAVSAAMTLTMATAHAADMDKCKVVADGKGLIKENKDDCKSATSSCAGQNKAGDPEAWILVPHGMCEKINAGDVAGVPQNILDKIDVSQLPKKN